MSAMTKGRSTRYVNFSASQRARSARRAGRATRASAATRHARAKLHARCTCPPAHEAIMKAGNFLSPMPVFLFNIARVFLFNPSYVAVYRRPKFKSKSREGEHGMHFCLPEVVFRSIAAQFNLALVQLPELKSRDRDESRDIHLSPEAEHRTPLCISPSPSRCLHNYQDW